MTDTTWIVALVSFLAGWLGARTAYMAMFRRVTNEAEQRR